MRRPLFFLFLVVYTFCRADRADSLMDLLKRNPADTERVNLLNWICYEKYQSDISSAIPYARQALALAKEIGFAKGTVNAYLYLSYLSRAAGENANAIAQIDSAETICDQSKLEYLKVKTLNQKGNIYGDLGDLSKSLDYYIQASKIAERFNDKRTLLGAYGNIGITFLSLKQYNKSKEYMKRAIVLANELKEYKNQGNILNNLGAIYFDENKIDSAIPCFKEGEKIFIALGYQRGLGYCNYYLGNIYTRKNKLPVALTYFEKAAKIFLESGNTTELPNIYLSMAEVYLKLNLPDNALDYAKKAVLEAEKESSYTDMKEGYMVLKKIYEKNGDYKTALYYYTRYATLKDSLFNTESTAQMAEMQTKYESEKKENENKLLQEKNDSNAKTIQQQQYFGIAVGFICVLLVAFAIYFFRSNKQKQRTNVDLERKNNLIEKQKQLVEEKQKEILDSIHYAKRIQGTLLTSERYIARSMGRLKKTG